jgi:ribonuclease R
VSQKKAAVKAKRAGGKAKPMFEPTKRPDGSKDNSDKKNPAHTKSKAEKARKKKSRTKANKARGKSKNK